MEHILWVPLFNLEGLGELLQLCLWQKSKALGAASNIPCCLFTQPSAQRFQGSTAPRADLALDFPGHLGFPSTQTFHFTCIDQLSLHTLAGAKKSQARDFRSLSWAAKPFSSCCILLCSQKRWNWTQLQSFPHLIHLLREVSFSLRQSQLGEPRFCRNCALIVPL